MYEIELLDLTTGKEFMKTFYDYYAFRKFLCKCDHSKKLKWTAWRKVW